jgi:ribulose-phosphate 3-epimerase
MTTKSLSGPAAIAALPRNRLLGEFSLWSADLANMERDLQLIDPFVDLHHIDVADARFTPGFLFFPDLDRKSVV